MIEKAPCVNYGGIWTAACFYSSRTRKSAGCWTRCLDDRLHPTEWGPFDSIDKFNAFFYHDIVRQRPEDYSLAQDFQGSLAKVRGQNWPTVFTHDDLGFYNILWKDGRIVGIIDWEYAGVLWVLIRDHISGVGVICQIGGRVHQLVPWKELDGGVACSIYCMHIESIQPHHKFHNHFCGGIIVICACQAVFL